MKRVYAEVIKDHFNSKNGRFNESKMLFLAGPRQVGKTTTSLDSFPNALYLNWDNLEHRAEIVGGPSRVFSLASGDTLHDKKLNVIFDEIHKYPNWKTFLKGFYDTYGNRLHICVTGSARLNIYKYGGDSMMGRYFLYRMHPLSLAELVAPSFLTKETRSPKNIDTQALNTLMRYGGYPEPFLRNDQRFYNRWKKLRLEQLFNEDLRDITAISDIGRIRLLAEQIMNMAGGVVNYSHFAKNLQVSVDTVRRWFDVLESVYFCFRVRPYHNNINKAIRKAPKVFLWDWTLAKDIGKRNENFIACHLLKYAHYRADTGIGDCELYYIRDKNKREVDFLITKDDSPWACLEVKTSMKPISEALHYFKMATKAPHAFQLTFNAPFLKASCFKETKPVKVPVTTFLSQLV